MTGFFISKVFDWVITVALGSLGVMDAIGGHAAWAAIDGFLAGTTLFVSVDRTFESRKESG